MASSFMRPERVQSPIPTDSRIQVQATKSQWIIHSECKGDIPWVGKSPTFRSRSRVVSLEDEAYRGWIESMETLRETSSSCWLTRNGLLAQSPCAMAAGTRGRLEWPAGPPRGCHQRQGMERGSLGWAQRGRCFRLEVCWCTTKNCRWATKHRVNQKRVHSYLLSLLMLGARREDGGPLCPGAS